MAVDKLPRSDKPRNDLTAEYVRSVLDYDPIVGLFWWKTPGKNRVVGRLTGCVSAKGRVVIRVDYRLCYAHRLAWLIMTGKWPAHEIDHINGDPADNRWINLRLATHGENLCNLKRGTNNGTGYKGVSRWKPGNNYRAQIKKDYKYYHLGYFDTPEEAYEAYKKAAAVLFGEFVRKEEHL